MKKVILVVPSILISLVKCFSQNISMKDSLLINPNIAKPQVSVLNDWVEKIVIALLGALLGYLSNYLLSRRKERKESKELSYEIVVNDVITKEESPIKDNISISYRNKTVPNLFFVACSIKNTGQLFGKR